MLKMAVIRPKQNNFTIFRVLFKSPTHTGWDYVKKLADKYFMLGSL